MRGRTYLLSSVSVNSPASPSSVNCHPGPKAAAIALSEPSPTESVIMYTRRDGGGISASAGR
jgi:hypothetical protein